MSFRRKTIASDQTFGQTLRQRREELKLSLEELAAQTHIRRKHLAALESGDFNRLPEDVYIMGYLKCYARALGLPARVLLNQYRGERLAAERLGYLEVAEALHSALPTGQTVDGPRFTITPRLFWITASFVVIVGIAGYLWYQVHGFMAAPNLQVADGQPEMIVSSPTIQITGQTEGSAYVTINAEPITTDADGKFSQEVHLEPGLNTIEVAAKNRLNKETKKQLRVLAKLPGEPQ